MKFTRITINPEKMDGVPCIRDLRIPVATVVQMTAEGMTAPEIIKTLPDLQTEDVREALQYAATAVQDRVMPYALP
ncbi:MAG: hypothetical protein A2751_00870 [Candidatus Doudnabacteria bacterium RIFCSPHIGHO2_01_FULL_46_14]|uniref:Antitoxin n=1 Tax=Candidatus Doudnabacteria bacterium RIFCSPHIGHO2_01_FULL_46_14 TaxID=1817824 RepID=A0A1F5NMS7_9BACT|nr:MAG: hypothetical protein A2751_00870 [Candidatus Doudnabacteria bacterium RIFCSPHIGHO2_01_FULL_46_14]